MQYENCSKIYQVQNENSNVEMEQNFFKKPTNEKALFPILACCPLIMNSHQSLHRNSCGEQRMPTSFDLAHRIQFSWKTD